VLRPVLAILAASLAGLVACGRSTLPFDTGSVDASAPPPDAHEASSPPPDVRDASTPSCPEIASTDPWEDRLGAHTLADRGVLLDCAHLATYTQAETEKSSYFLPAAGPADNGYELFVIQYVSEGRLGVARAVTGLLYLPSGRATDVPIVALDHGSSGLGPPCGPSHVPALTDPLAVPLVGRGYAIVAPDYAGMGVDNGMTSYLVGAEEAAATLDGVLALRQFHELRFDAARLGTDFFVAGHSQGGHAALFTHQLFDPRIGVNLLGSIAFAPALGNARNWSFLFEGPQRPLEEKQTYAAMSLYARMLYDGAPAANAWLLPPAQEALPSLFHHQCVPQLASSLAARFPTLGDLYQPTFLAAAEKCTFGRSCMGFEPWAAAFVAEQPGSFSSTAPSLILQGMADTVALPATVSCIVDRMKARGTPVIACAYAGDNHATIDVSAAPDMIRWIAARRSGSTPDVCPAPLDVPCSGP
jgi:pimeloyl-ACP methyl ester carboxylesterase